MIDHGDLSRPARVLVLDGDYRPWWGLGVIRRNRWRLVFAGFINSVHYGGGFGGTTFELEDQLSRLKRSEWHG